MPVVYEMQSGAMTYGMEYTLSGTSLILRELRYGTGEPRGGLKPETKRFATAADAAAYLRWRISQHRGNYKLVDGDAPALDPHEDFRRIKDKTKAYRYYEHAGSKQWVDLDLDASNMIVTTGPIGAAGSETIVEFDWDGDARTGYKTKVAELERDGYVLVESTAKPKTKPTTKPRKR
jgi:hypothetical protein